MWIFLLSDTFIFTCFLTGYMNVRMSTTETWPNPSEVFALHLFGQDVPLLLIAIMTFVLITRSGTMAMAVNYGYRRDRGNTALPDVGDRAARRDLRRHAGLRVDQADHRKACGPGRTLGRAAVRLRVLHDHRLPRPARDGGVIYLLIVAASASHRGFYDRKGSYETVEVAGLYWHFVDLVWVFIFAFFYLW